MLDSAGALVVEYKYDAWGRKLSVSGSLAATLGVRNPFRYRGYVYDDETGLYCTDSRMYSPMLCRFISADGTDALVGEEDLLVCNLFTYCNNSPVVSAYWDGEAVANVVGGIIGGVSGAALGVLLAKYLGLGGWKKAALIAAAAIGGAALGAFLGPYISKLGAKIAAKLGIRSVPKIGTSFGKLGTVTRNLKPVIRDWGRHGAQRMLERGVSKSLAQKIVSTGKALAQGPNKTLYFTKAGVVVLTTEGKVVTAYSAAFFDPTIKALVKMFYR